MTEYVIFVVSNPLSAIHAALINRDRHSNSNCILIIDKGKRKKSFSDEILLAASGASWRKIINLSINLPENFDLKPSLSKRLTRKFKHLPVIRGLYHLSLRYYHNNEEKRLITELSNLLSDIHAAKITLYLLTQTRCNSALQSLFPESTYYYFEHGLPDYLFSLKDNNSNNGGLFCVFSEEFKSFIGNSNLNIRIFPFTENKKYHQYIQRVYQKDPRILQIETLIPDKSTLVIMQPFEKYEIRNDFWFRYITNIREIYPDASSFLVIKPHPLQSKQTLEELKMWLRMNSVDFLMLDSVEFSTLSCEVLYASLQSKFKLLFSPFSYSIYFLSKLFPDTGCQYFHSYSSLKNWFSRSPAMFRNQYLEHAEIIEKCFSVHCSDLQVDSP